MTRTSFGATIVAVLMGTGSFAADLPSGLPRPPQQDAPWTPPKADVPAALIEAARVLFDQGLADPRGCGYRQVELAGEVEERRFDLRPRPTIHAFVLPFDTTGSPRYAVAWNGLVYPVTGLGPAADLDADIFALKRAVELSSKGGRPRASGFYFAKDPIRGGSAISDIEAARQGFLTPMKAVFLLRLGRGDLAEILWKAGMKASYTETDADAFDPYPHLAGDWEWALFGRAAMAHERGDDPLALATIRELTRVRALVAKRVPEGPAWANPFFVDFLEQIPRFLADQERRAREAAQPPRREPRDRVAGLIRDLDGIRGARWPDWTDPTATTTVRALIAEGDAAVGPLLDCVEHDDRLTRVVHNWNDVLGPGGGLSTARDLRYLEVLGVEKIALHALEKILGPHDFGPWPPEVVSRKRKLTRAELAAGIRAYWKKNRGLREQLAPSRRGR